MMLEKAISAMSTPNTGLETRCGFSV